jgi:enamine deaminase RidA (YjgF/YER057c/UK114 family)
MTRKAFASERAPRPAGSYHIAVEAGGLVFLAGQTPRDRDNVRHVAKPFAVQASHGASGSAAGIRTAVTGRAAA